MALDYSMVRERVPQRYSFFRSTFFERRMLFARAVKRCATAYGGVRLARLRALAWRVAERIPRQNSIA